VALATARAVAAAAGPAAHRAPGVSAPDELPAKFTRAELAPRKPSVPVAADTARLVRLRCEHAAATRRLATRALSPSLCPPAGSKVGPQLHRGERGGERHGPAGGGGVAARHAAVVSARGRRCDGRGISVGRWSIDDGSGERWRRRRRRRGDDAGAAWLGAHDEPRRDGDGGCWGV